MMYYTGKRKPVHSRKRIGPGRLLLIIIFAIVLCILFLIFRSRLIPAELHNKAAQKMVPTEKNQMELLKKEADPSYSPSEPTASKFLQVPMMCQNPELPTGCEATSTAMALSYLGIQTEPVEFADLLPRKELERKGDQFYGPDPNELFVGDPAGEQDCYGCFEHVILETVNQNYETCTAKKVNGSLNELCAFLDQGTPVIVWVTQEMAKPVYQASWELPDGTEFTWPGREHCMLLTGYDEDFYYYNDPISGACLSFDKELSEKRFEELGSRAVVIQPAR